MQEQGSIRAGAGQEPGRSRMRNMAVHGAKRLRIDHPSSTTMTIWIRLHSRIVTMSTNKFLHSIATLRSSKTRIRKLLDKDFICIRFGSAGINDEYVKSIR